MPHTALRIVCATTAVAALVGCSSTGTSTSSTPSGNTSSASNGTGSGSPSGSVLDTVIQKKELRVCATGDYLPYTHVDDKGDWSGLDVDLANQLAKTLDAKVTWVHTTWKKLPDDFQSSCDLAVGGITGTTDRARIAFFTEPLMQDGKTPITKCADVAKYDTIAEINQPGVRSISPIGGTNERFAKANYPRGKLVLWEDNTTIFDQILAGKADAMTTDASETRWAQKNHPGLCAVHPDKPFSHDQKVWLTTRGDTVWQQYVDEWLTTAHNSGDFTTAQKKWLA